eukprot:GDKH01024574.1.p2 GENE.GDKH01024574.1~~GDKH01024574.1.p2  ORF type:complete len:65 (-),score=14.85 GDKH01024574.1:240-434(-)
MLRKVWDKMSYFGNPFWGASWILFFSTYTMYGIIKFQHVPYYMNKPDDWRAVKKRIEAEKAAEE